MMLARAVLAQVHGQRFGPLLSGGALVGLRAIGAVGQALDRLLVPGLRDQAVRSPVIIIGAPRTGTTFLHRTLVSLGVGQGQQLWQMLVPSLVLQRALAPLVPRLEALSPARHHDAAVHETGLGAVETEDAALLFRHFDGLFPYAFLLSWDPTERFAEVDPTRPGATARDLDHLEGLWRRRLVAAGPGARVVAKAASLALRVPELLARFPDARLIYTVRDPVAAIPSALSLVQSTLAARFGLSVAELAARDPAALARHRHRVYRALVGLHEDFARAWGAPDFPRERVLVVDHDDLVHRAAPTLARVLDFAAHPRDGRLDTALAELGARQARRRSGHRYGPADFGLDADQIRRDCATSRATFRAGRAA